MGKVRIFSSANDLVLPQNHKVGQGSVPQKSYRVAQQVPDRDNSKNRLKKYILGWNGISNEVAKS